MIISFKDIGKRKAKLIKIYTNECKKGYSYSIEYNTQRNISDEENYLLAWLKAKKNSEV